MKNFKSVIVTTVILTLICAIATGALAFTNELTADRIAEAAVEAEKEAMSRVIKADGYTEGTVTLNGEHTYYTATAGGQTKGYIFTVTENGYGGEIKVMIGIGTDAKVIAIEVLDASNETPGLGQNVTRESFWDRFKGQMGELEVKQEIEPVTGATISSRAVTDCVNFAFRLYDAVIEEGGNNG